LRDAVLITVDVSAVVEDLECCSRGCEDLTPIGSVSVVAEVSPHPEAFACEVDDESEDMNVFGRVR
jgi:hypothetical protein